jgi:hypothetical protein
MVSALPPARTRRKQGTQRVTKIPIVLACVLALVELEAQSPPQILSARAEHKSGIPTLTRHSDQYRRGCLLLDARELRFQDRCNGKKIKVYWSSPVREITRVTNRVDVTGLPLVTPKRQEEFVSVRTENAAAANVVVFQVDPNTSEAIIAKIEFAAKQVRQK